MERWIRRLTAAVLVAALGVIPAAAQGPVPVNVEHEGEDQVGQAFAYAVREQLRRSANYPLTESGNGVVLSLVSLDIGTGDKGISAAISYNLILKRDPDDVWPWNVTHGVIIVGREKVDTMARSLMGTLDASIVRARQSLR